MVFILVAIGVFMCTLDSSIVNIAVPTIMDDFDVRLPVVQWVVMAYLLTVSALLLCFGRLSDIRGRQWVYMRGMVVFTIGSALCGTAPGAAWLIVARALQGVGAAMIMACTPALVVDHFPPMERGRALGIVGTIVATGLTAGPALGGAILSVASWRYIFYINIPVGVAAVALSIRILGGGREKVSSGESFDWAGAALLAISLGALLTGLSRGSEWGYLSARTLAFLAVFAVCAPVLIAVELKSEHPVLDPDLFKNRLFSLSMLAAMLLFLSLFVVVFLMPFYLLKPGGFTEQAAGIMMTIPFVFLFVMSPFSGYLSDKVGSRILCTAGMAVMAISLYSLARLPLSAGAVAIAWRLSLAGLGASLFLPPNSAAALSSVPDNRRGIASATVATARNLGMVVGVALAGAVFDWTFAAQSGGRTLKEYGPELSGAFMSAFHAATLAGAVVAAGAVAVAWLRGPDVRFKRPPGIHPDI